LEVSSQSSIKRTLVVTALPLPHIVKSEALMNRLTGVLLFSALLLTTTPTCIAGEGASLMTMIAEWQYPKSTINGATMTDGKTVNSDGNRTIQSIVCKTVLTTDDSVDEVIAFYKSKLNPDKNTNSKPDEDIAKQGRSVVFHNDSEGRSFSIHVIVVNTDHASTTLVISRGLKEQKTHIAWKHYARL